MTYWTIMMITVLSGPLEGQVSTIAFKNESLCYEAAETMSASLKASYDYKMQCMVSSTPSNSIRPKRNPSYNG
jgi:hypothetical protein